jgi:hypothetical protein
MSAIRQPAELWLRLLGSSTEEHRCQSQTSINGDHDECEEKRVCSPGVEQRV